LGSDSIFIIPTQFAVQNRKSAKSEEREIPKTAKSRKPLNSGRREIPSGGTAESDKGTGCGGPASSLRQPGLRAVLARGSSALRDSAQSGIQRRSGFAARRDFARFSWRLSCHVRGATA